MAQECDEESLGKSIEKIKDIADDASVPKNIKLKLQAILFDLDKDLELPLKLNKTLNELDEIVSDINLQPHTRTQIWSIVSEFEKMTQSEE